MMKEELIFIILAVVGVVLYLNYKEDTKREEVRVARLADEGKEKSFEKKSESNCRQQLINRYPRLAQRISISRLWTRHTRTTSAHRVFFKGEDGVNGYEIFCYVNNEARVINLEIKDGDPPVRLY